MIKVYITVNVRESDRVQGARNIWKPISHVLHAI